MGIPPLIEAEDVTVRMGRQKPLDRINFRLPPGITAVIGPNGAGKTTLIRVLATLQSYDGSLRLWGGEARSEPARSSARAHTGYLPQSVPLDRRLTVSQTVAYAAWLKGLPRRDTVQAVNDALTTVHLEELANRKAKHLSGGQRRRLGVAAAIVARPRLLLLDEPTAGLDPVERASLLRLIRDLSEHTSVVYSTHLADEVAETSDTVLVLHEGTSRWCGTIESFLENAPAASRTEAVAGAYAATIESVDA